MNDPAPMLLTTHEPPLTSPKDKTPGSKNAESVASSMLALRRKKRRNVFVQIYVWVFHRSTLVLLLLLLLIGLICAISHYVMFDFLDKTMTEHRRFRQSHVTTMSLLLTTIFKSCMIGCVGLAFAQHMWYNLRQQYYSISRIEQLFCIRSNPFQLSRLRALIEAPTLFIMALFVWLVPIAVIYPPSALTVSVQPYLVNTSIAVPVLNSIDPNFDPDKYEKRGSHRPFKNEWISQPHNTLVMNYLWPNKSLIYLAKSVLISGKVANFSPLVAENASYVLDFRGPQVVCHNSSIMRADVVYGRGSSPFEIKWWSVTPRANLTIRSPSSMHWYPNESPGSLTNFTRLFAGNESILRCEPLSLLYSLNISYSKGVRRLEYMKSDSRAFQPEMSVRYSYNSSSQELFPSAVRVENRKLWLARIQENLWTWTEWSILLAAMRALEFSCDAHFNYRPPRNRSLANGTTGTALGMFTYGCDTSTSSLLGQSRFNPQRYNDERFGGDELNPKDWIFDEHMINDFITNVTISALTLDLGRNMTTVHVTRYRTIYDFSSPLDLILPYALSFGIAMVLVGIGIQSLRFNGIAAIDGGFLQIMSTTVGRTKMEDLVSEQRNEIHVNRNEELLEMKIRYGELVDENGEGTGVAGFGTDEETLLMSKGWQKVDPEH